MEYDESEVVTSALGNKARFNMGQIKEIEFKKPTFFKNGLIKFKLYHKNDIFCHFTKKRSDEAKKSLR